MKHQQIKVNQRKSKRKDTVNIELDIKCSCSQSADEASIQFSRRYLQCQSLMPVRAIRLFIESILPHSRTIQVSIFDSNHRLLKDSDRLCSLKRTCTSAHYIRMYFTLLNTITSFANCSCVSPSMEENSPSLSTTIQQDAIDQILSTCLLAQQVSISPLSSPAPNPSNQSLGFVHVLTPASCELDVHLDEATMDHITSMYGEICSSCSTLKRCTSIQDDLPLDLSMKTYLSSSQTKLIKT